MRTPPAPLPRPETLGLLVGRITTIKLAYWALLAVAELALARAVDRPVQDRLPLSYAAGALIALAALAWAVRSARAIDRRAGGLYRSLPTVATAFVAASVVATPASLPLLLIARQRSLEGCPAGTCHFEPILLWVGSVVIGTFLIPIAFAVGMRRRGDMASAR